VRSAGLRVLGGFSAAGPVLFTLAWAVASSIEPGYRPWQEDISALAALGAAHPWITMTGELALGAAALASASVVLLDIGGRDVRVGASLLAVGGTAIIVQALCREDCRSELATCVQRVRTGAVSWHHTLHGPAAVIAFMTLVAVPLVFVRPFRQDPRWRGLAGPSLAAVVAGSVLLLGSAITSGGQSAGLIQRMLVTVPALWIAAVGLRVLRDLPHSREVQRRASASSP
jgi:hypothetical protein